MTPLDFIRRLAWAVGICIGPIAGSIELLTSPRYGRTGYTGITDRMIERAAEAGATWAMVAAPLLVLLYYACKYVLTGHIGDGSAAVTSPPSETAPAANTPVSSVSSSR